MPYELPDAVTRRTPFFVRAFKWVAFFEAFTWAGLLNGMFLKYVTETTELGVKLFGSLHGAAFVVYCGLALVVALLQKWSVRTTVLALMASIPPFATVAFEIYAQKTGRFRQRPDVP